MPNQDPREEITALAIRSAQELSIRSSLVSRGLREIANGFQEDYSKSVDDRALELFHQNKFEEAVSICTAALHANPKDECLWLIKGMCFSKQEKYDELLQCAIPLLEIDGQNPRHWYLAAQVLHRLQRFEEELKYWQKCVQIDPHHDGAWKGIGNCLFSLGKYEEAIDAFDSGLRQDPSDEHCRSQRDIALSELSGSQEDPILFVVYDTNNGWHVMKEDDMQWEPVDDGRERRQRPLQTCFGPFFSNFDPNEGPVGSGRELAEALCEEKRKLYRDGPAPVKRPDA